MSAESATTVYAAETVLVFGFRGALFYACRRYLLRNLYHDLQDLSGKQFPSPATYDPGETELDILPVPSPATAAHAASNAKRPLHSWLSRGLFSLCFSESCTLFLLLMFQAVDFLQPRTRLLNWKLSLAFLLGSVMVVVPVSYSVVLSSGGSSGTGTRISASRLALNLIPIFLFLFALSCVPLPAGMPTHTLLTSALSRLTVIGTVILGSLSGFGAIATAWDFFPRKHRTNPTAEEVRAAEHGLRQVRQDLERRRSDLSKLQASQKPSAGTSWFSRNLPFQGSSEASSVSMEISGMEALEYEMSRKLDVLKQREAEAKFGKTLTGKIVRFGGRLFAIYCVYRVVNAAVNLVIPSRRSAPGESTSTNADVVSLVLAHLVSVLPFVHVPQDRVAVVSRQISLGLVGVIILSSIRLVLRGVARMLRVTSRSLGASLMLLTLAQLMSLYLLSTLVQLRTSFPPPPARADTEPDAGMVNLFSMLPEFQFFGSLFDGSFLLAAAASAAVRWFGDKLEGAMQA